MINREDMMELTRRMTVKRTSLIRVAGAYMDQDGFVDGTFNTSFLKLKDSEKQSMLKIAKSVLFSGTNTELKEYSFSATKKEQKEFQQLLYVIRDCGLKNDALIDVFYELVGETYKASGDYAILLFHGIYDVPIKFSDKSSYYESEEVYEYLIAAICPLKGEYEPDLPEFGWLYPAFSDRSATMNCIDIFQMEQALPHTELLAMLGVNE